MSLNAFHVQIHKSYDFIFKKNVSFLELKIVQLLLMLSWSG